MTKTLLFAALMCLLAAGAYPAPTDMSAFFRSGQTFITWCEDVSQSNETYRIYRSSSAITTGNLSSATLVATVKEGSSYFREMHNCNGSLLWPDSFYVSRYIIQPMTNVRGTQLSDTTGLFVNTIQEPGQVQSYYAVTTVASGGAEEAVIGAGNSTGPITEQKQYPDAVKYCTDATRDFYILWLDHRIYSPYMGNGFPIAITRDAFSQGGSMPSLTLEGIGGNFPAATYTNWGNLEYNGNGLPTWYLGYHMSPAYDGGCQAVSGQVIQDTVANYVQYKYMQALLWSRRHYNITEPKFHIDGNSMGASGSWGFLIAYPSFVTSIWSNQGLTQYRVPGINGVGDTMWGGTVYDNYGHYTLANPAKFLPINDPQYPDLDWVTQFSGENVYDIRDVAAFAERNKAKSFGIFSGGHTFEDGSILFDWQGLDFEQWVKDSRQCLGYAVRHGNHNWGAVSYKSPMCGYLRWDESRPGFSNVPPIEGCQYNNPSYPDTGSRTYMIFVEWGTQEHSILGGKKIAETTTSWSIPIMNIGACAVNNGTYSVDITPRNLQVLEICEGDTFTYQVTNAAGTTVEATGDIVADSLQLLLIPDVPIRLTGAVASVTLKNRGNNFPCGDQDPPMRVAMNAEPEMDGQPEIQAYPNPFNPSIMITISNTGSRMTNLDLRIFNIHGKLVKDFSSKISRSAVWDATGLPSGVYVVRARVGKSVLTRTISYIK